jgi:hypothetical protein
MVWLVSNLASRRCSGYSHQSDQTRSIVGDAGGVKALAIAAHVDGGVGKDGVQVGDQHDHVARAAGALTDDVADVVGCDLQACIREELGQVGAARGFFKGGRRNFRDADLLLGDGADASVKFLESQQDAGISGQLGELRRGPLGLGCGKHVHSENGGAEDGAAEQGEPRSVHAKHPSSRT